MNRKTHKHLLITMMLITIVLLSTSWGALGHGDAPLPTPTPDANSTTLDDVPTYYEHIQPILAANCTSCHTEGNFGHDSFQMDTIDQIVSGAEDIALVVSTGYMPPWPPSDLSPEFLYDRSLPDEDIAQIIAWMEAGAPLGTENTDTAPETEQAQPVVEADLILEMPEPYTPNPERTDDYRCFLLDPGFTEDTFVIGYDIIPGNTGIVHHTVLFPATSAQRAEAEQLNGSDGKPGWECFGGTGLSSGGPDTGMLRPLLPLIEHVGGIDDMQILAQREDAVALLDEAIDAVDAEGGNLRGMIAAVGGTETLVNLLRQGLGGNDVNVNQPVSGVIGAWVPGSTPAQFPQDTGLLFSAGSFIVMQMHYNTSANSEPDQSQLILDTANEPDLAAARVIAINAPVEIPCPEGVTGEACSREYAIAERGDGSDLVLPVCGQSLDQYLNQDPTNAESFCDHTISTSGWVLSIMSHQHTLGKTTRTLLNPDTPDEQILIDIPVWDFDWQGSYWYAEPIWLDEGDVIRVICTYDNSVTRANPEPRYVVAGEGTSDEMCLNFITMLPAEAGSPMPVMGASVKGQ